ncbi:MAG TPA: glucosyltransferase domain-containing protein [Hyphomicrobiaceae bacterium]|nr:glucosyltransferase domain-containing protein [Hyphomicrobiaceae bacterium]
MARLYDLRKSLFIAIICLLICYLPLIDVRYYFLDDMGRAMVGFGYTYTGRPLVDILLSALTQGLPFNDVSPAPQLLGVVALALAATLLGDCFGIRSSGWIAVFALTMAGNPYFLENMSFRFDSGFMALGLLCAVTPFWLARSAPSLPVVSSAVLLFASLCLYQPTINCYPVIALFLTAQSLAHRPMVSALVFALRCMAPLVLAVLAYRLLWTMVPASYIPYYVAHGDFAPLSSALHTGATNFAQYAVVITRDWGSTGLGVLWAATGVGSAILLAGRIARASGRSWKAKLGVAAMAVALLALMAPAAFLAQIFLVHPVFASRTFTGVVMVTAVIAATLITAGSGLAGRLAKISVVFQAIALLGVNYAYANALRAQERFDDRVTAAIVDDILEVAPSGEASTFAISGWTGRSPLSEAAVARYPAIQRLVFSVIHQDSYWAEMRFRIFGLRVTPASLSPAEKMTIICNTEPRKRNGRYDLYLINHTALIRFKNDGVSCP